MKRFISLLLIAVMAFTLFTACKEEEEEFVYDNSKTYYASIVVEDYGTIVVQLSNVNAPKTVENFVTLAVSGFYDGLTFHRIMEGFMMQGGDPNADGTGGSDKNIEGEFSANGYMNSLSHKRGVISMARQGENPFTGDKNYDTASSQFFICHQDSVFLDGQYAAFGFVTEGMDVVDKICTEAAPIDSNGTIPAANQPVIETITITWDE
ncbi:MAG: peptidylprolyl isomerase [Clostridia bacterium]|nr:peptidylprolyl isomerase [Clostridia bacterium]